MPSRKASALVLMVRKFSVGRSSGRRPEIELVEIGGRRKVDDAHGHVARGLDHVVGVEVVSVKTVDRELVSNQR